MNKNLSKAIMLKQSWGIFFSGIGLRKITVDTLSKEIYVEHFCEKVREYFSNLIEKKVCDNKTFWKLVKPYYQTK